MQKVLPFVDLWLYFYLLLILNFTKRYLERKSYARQLESLEWSWLNKIVNLPVKVLKLSQQVLIYSDEAQCTLRTLYTQVHELPLLW